MSSIKIFDESVGLKIHTDDEYLAQEAGLAALERALAEGRLHLADLQLSQRRLQQLLAEALRSPDAARALLRRLAAAHAQREAERRQMELELA
jgi:hypothetical protein